MNEKLSTVRADAMHLSSCYHVGPEASDRGKDGLDEGLKCEPARGIRALQTRGGCTEVKRVFKWRRPTQGGGGFFAGEKGVGEGQ